MITEQIEQWYKHETKRIMQTHSEEIRRLFKWDDSELEFDFLGFLHIYANLNIPKDFVVIDFGCYQAIQANYFAEHKAYIGVDVGVPIEWCFRQHNATYYQMFIQDFIKNKLSETGLDLNKVVAICSYVPDDEAQKMIADTFPYHKVVYSDKIISENLP